MPTYELKMTVVFNADNEIPETHVKGNATILEGVFDHLPAPENFDWDTSVGELTLKQV